MHIRTSVSFVLGCPRISCKTAGDGTVSVTRLLTSRAGCIFERRGEKICLEGFLYLGHEHGVASLCALQVLSTSGADNVAVTSMFLL